MAKSFAHLNKCESLSDLTDKAKIYGSESSKEKSRKERIGEEIKKKKEEKYYKTEEDLEQKVPKKRIPISYLLEHGDKISLEYACEYYKDEFKLLILHPSGEIIGSEIKLKNRYEAWILLVPLNIYKDVLMMIPREKIKYITGKDIIEVAKQYPKYAELMKEK